jgi:Protein of unknown function (DUF4012)
VHLLGSKSVRARRMRRAMLPIVAIGLAGVVAGGWLSVRGLTARGHLDDARRRLVGVQTGLINGTLHADDPRLRQAIDAASADTAQAHRLTSDRLWRLADALPVAGCPLRSFAGLATAGDRITREVVRPLAALGPAALPATSTTGLRVDVRAFKAAVPSLRSALDRLPDLTSTVAGVSTCGAVGDHLGLAAARTELLGRLRRLQGSSRDLDVATRVLPALLGADGPRRYLLVVQNGAESRATGGILGGIGVLSARDGQLSLGSIVGNSAVPPLPRGFTLPLADDVRSRYARNGVTRYWQDANLTPDFPTAAGIYSAMWKASTGQAMDGVLALDATTLAHLVSVIGPVRMPDGSMVSGGGLVPLLESRIYAKISDNAARDRFFAAAGTAIYTQLLARRGGSLRLLPALARSVREGRLLLWSAHRPEQQALLGTPLAGAVPTARGPYLAVVTQNAASGKLDYYLHRETHYQAWRMPDGTGQAVVSVRLANSAPRTGLSSYVLAHDTKGRPITSNPGHNVLYVSVFGGVGAAFDGATLDGRPVNLESDIERGHSVFSTWVSIDPGQSRTLRIELSEPQWRGTLSVRRQPLVNPERLTVAGIRVQTP